MHDVAIIGAGLSGLALAVRLAELGKDVHVYEARDRLGGRILTEKIGKNGAVADMGPSWLWPETQPQLAALIADLGLDTFAQHDTGAVVHLTDPDQGASVGGMDPVHNGAHRVVGGMAKVIEALAARLGQGRITLGAALERVEDQGDHVLLCYSANGTRTRVIADQVVLALPPRVLATQVEFSPKLSDPMDHAMRATPTWMARAAKAVAHYPKATWRDAGQSGSAFVAHERAVLSETFDQSGPDGSAAALGGFLALDAQTRQEFAGGMPMLLENQFAQLFGSVPAPDEISFQDWATEPFTCSELDQSVPSDGERRAAHPLLRLSLWDGRLHLAGAETARLHPGHMAGALEAADRVFTRLQETPVRDQETNMAQWFASKDDLAFASYQQSVTRLLSHHFPREVTRVATVESMGSLFDAALDHLSTTGPCDGYRTENRDRAISQVKPALHGKLNRLIGRIIGFNRSSCALRNFPAEHTLPEDYIRLILQDASTLGRGFLNDIDAILAARAGDA